MSEPTLFSSAGTAQQDVTRQTLSELAAAMSDAPRPFISG
jgi:GntR family histidine utilization transcriptional repressor